MHPRPSFVVNKSFLHPSIIFRETYLPLQLLSLDYTRDQARLPWDYQPWLPSDSDSQPGSQVIQSQARLPSDSDYQLWLPSGSNYQARLPSGSDYQPRLPSDSDYQPSHPRVPVY